MSMIFLMENKRFIHISMQVYDKEFWKVAISNLRLIMFMKVKKCAKVMRFNNKYKLNTTSNPTTTVAPSKTGDKVI